MSDIKYCTKNSNEFVYKTPIKSAQKHFRTNEDYKELSGRDARELKRIADDPNDYRVKASSFQEINGKNLTQIFENL